MPKNLMAVAQKKNSGYTYSDYLTWPEEGRMELIEFSSPSFHPGEGVLHLTVLPEAAIDLDRVFAE